MVAQTGVFLHVFDRDMMTRGLCTKEHDHQVSRRQWGVSYVLSDRLSEQLLRWVPSYMCLSGTWWSMDCMVMSMSGILRRWWSIFANTAIYANVFSYFNVSRCFLAYPAYFSHLGLSTEHIWCKPVVDVINWGADHQATQPALVHTVVTTVVYRANFLASTKLSYLSIIVIVTIWNLGYSHEEDRPPGYHIVTIWNLAILVKKIVLLDINLTFRLIFVKAMISFTWSKWPEKIMVTAEGIM